MPQFDLICLANSRKLGGHCVAGLRLDGGGWVRPVGKPADGVLHAADYTLTDGTPAADLDVIRVSVAAPRPAPHQPENWVIDGRRWQLLQRPMPKRLWPVLNAAVDAGPELLRGHADRTAWADFEAKPAAASLVLVAPESLYLYEHERYGGKFQARGRFDLGAGDRVTVYDLPITDANWEELIFGHPPRLLRQDDQPFVVTISLCEPFGGQCYKIIAAIIRWPG